jgi:hypothetical protein
MSEKCIKRYTSTSWGMRGYFATLIGTFECDDGWIYDDVIQTGYGSYKDGEGARREAREWAIAEGIKFEG